MSVKVRVLYFIICCFPLYFWYKKKTSFCVYKNLKKNEEKVMFSSCSFGWNCIYFYLAVFLYKKIIIIIYWKI